MPTYRPLRAFLFFLHPNPEQIAAWIAGRLTSIERDAVESHLVTCERCQVLTGNVLLDELEEAQRRSDAS